MREAYQWIKTISSHTILYLSASTRGLGSKVKNNIIMRTFRLVGMALVAVAVCLGFTACNNDDDLAEATGLNKALVGVWEQDGDNDIIQVKSDYTVIWYESAEHYEENDPSRGSSRIEINGETVLWYDSKKGEDFKLTMKLRPKEISANTIVWKEYDYDDDETDENTKYGLWTWTRYSK